MDMVENRYNLITFNTSNKIIYFVFVKMAVHSYYSDNSDDIFKPDKIYGL